MTTGYTNEDDHDSTDDLYLEDYGDDNHDLDDNRVDAHLLTNTRTSPAQRSWYYLRRLRALLSYQQLQRTVRKETRRKRRFKSLGTYSWSKRLLLVCQGLLAFVLLLLAFTGAFLPSYTKPQPHYRALRQRINASNDSGRGNVNNEKVFIAASIYDPGGELASGDWAQNILDLIDLLGPENVYLSIYENDSGDEAMAALAKLETKVSCNHTLISEAHLDPEPLPHIILPDGSTKIKRIEYLAEVRNRAIRPLETASVRFDRLLYVNDVMFNPQEAVQLLFSTNVNEAGRADYRAVCALDFINAFKFYDTFASRDLEGYSLGVPFFPWFSMPGESMNDLLAGKDAVRVRSCWGGMVAFDAKYFQKWQGESIGPTAASESPANLTEPYRFRAEKDLWWDSSECCLIHADIQSLDSADPGVYMNPFVRVAYDSKTLSWLGFTRRFERLYRPFHSIVDMVAKMPHFNPRRSEKSWQHVQETVWIGDASLPGNGSFQKVTRTAEHAGFCGRRALQVMKEKKGRGKNWEFVPVPSLYEGL